MGHDANLSLTLELHVSECPQCGNTHEKLLFSPGEGPGPEYTHYSVCPKTNEPFWLDTQSVSGVWQRLLEAAGVV